MLRPPVARARRSWSSLAASTALHAGLMALAVVLSRQPARSEADGTRDAPRQDRQVELVYLAPPPVPEPPPPEPPPPPERPRPEPEPSRSPPSPAVAPPTPPATPPPPREQTEPERNANAPPDAERSEGEDEAGRDGAGLPEGRPRDEAVTMESEARRIFGRPRLSTRPGVGPRAVRPMEAYVPENPAKCVPRPSAPRDSAAPVQFGIAEGRIFRGEDGRPLGGAHLQMLGTPYTAFTDANGAYRFRFDMSLVDHCRTQYVRVTAKGYESRLLVLVVGASVRSEDVHLERRSWWR